MTTAFDERKYGLRNGAADVITIKPAHGKGFIVLAKVKGAHPFVTWWGEDLYRDGLLVCSSGHYFEKFEDAVEDFADRD